MTAAGGTGITRILVVEDEPALLRALRINLRAPRPRTEPGMGYRYQP